MAAFRQFLAITLANLRCLPQRIGQSLVIVIGVACVVAVMISVLAMAMGFRQTMANSGSPDRIIVVGRGAESEIASSLTRANAVSILDAPGIERARDGRPIASAELLIQARVARRGDGADGFVTVRGVGARAFVLRPDLQLIEGRAFRSGVHELIVGKAAQAQFVGLQLGDRVPLREGAWTVVGVFSNNAGSHESELIADAETLMSAYRMQTFQSLTARVPSAEAYARLKKGIASDPTVIVDIKREPEYILAASEPFHRLLKFIAYLIGGVMATGALAGALNTMYSAVSARRREIATLRAIGFSGGVLIGSVFAEAFLLAGAGIVIGIAFAYLLFNGHVISTMGAGNGAPMAYPLSVTPGVVALGAAFGASIGLLGGLFPAIQAARSPVVVALRES